MLILIISLWGKQYSFHKLQFFSDLFHCGNCRLKEIQLNWKFVILECGFFSAALFSISIDMHWVAGLLLFTSFSVIFSSRKKCRHIKRPFRKFRSHTYLYEYVHCWAPLNPSQSIMPQLSGGQKLAILSSAAYFFLLDQNFRIFLANPSPL